MYAFCTYCSAEKNTEPGKVPAIHRYLSARIEKVYAAASQLGIGFFILSGEFGLIPPEQSIPWYDHLLQPEEVSGLAERMVKQIQEHRITGIVYFTKPMVQDHQVHPYHDALATACNQIPCPFFVVEVDLGS
jgi:hypothetical protein